MQASSVFFLQRCGLIGAVFVAIIAACTVASAREEAIIMYRDVAVPESLSVCGEAMPLGIPDVREMLDRELTISAWGQAQVFMWIKRAGRVFPVIEKKLAELGMPDDLKYLAVAESSLLAYIESNKGAVGTWQMIEETGVRNGLRKDELVDERNSPEIATRAALRYLQGLRQEFGCWTLALAAYNCGEARLRREMEIQKVTDYYRLNLPLETERFVFRIAAIKLIMQHPERYGYDIPQAHIYKPVKSDSIAVKLEKPVHITDVAQGIGTDFKIIKELNPELSGYQLPIGSYTLKVPPGLGDKTLAVLAALCLPEKPAQEKKR
jgi:membrane-bound lytic murein transglycosylase D